MRFKKLCKKLKTVINRSFKEPYNSYIWWRMDQRLIPICPAPPNPIPSVSKSLLPGSKQIQKLYVRWCFIFLKTNFRKVINWSSKKTKKWVTEMLKSPGLALKTVIKKVRAGQIPLNTWVFKRNGYCHIFIYIYIYINIYKYIYK